MSESEEKRASFTGLENAMKPGLFVGYTSYVGAIQNYNGFCKAMISAGERISQSWAFGGSGRRRRLLAEV